MLLQWSTGDAVAGHLCRETPRHRVGPLSQEFISASLFQRLMSTTADASPALRGAAMWSILGVPVAGGMVMVKATCGPVVEKDR